MFNSKQYKASFLEVLKLVIASNPSITDISITWRMFARQVRNIKITSFLSSFVNSNNNAPGSIIMSLEDYRICIANNVLITETSTGIGTSVFRTSYIDPNLDSVSVDTPVISSVVLNKDSTVSWVPNNLSAPVIPLRGMASGGVIERSRLLSYTGFAGYEGFTGYTGYVGNPNIHPDIITSESMPHYTNLVTSQVDLSQQDHEEKEQPKNSKIEWLKKQQEKNDVS